MRQLVLIEPQKFEIQHVSEPAEPAAEEVLVKVLRVGVCGTDLHAFHGRQPFFSYPRILGHELGVEVVSVGSQVTNLRPGDMCAVEPYLTCGKCIPCKSGRTNCCETLRCLGVHTDGGLREFITLPGDKLLPSAVLSPEQLALVETLGIGAHAVGRAQISSQTDLVLVIGAGPIGLSAMQFVKVNAATLVVADINDQRLEFCKNNMKADYLINTSSLSTEQFAAELINQTGQLPTVILDCSGNSASMARTFDLISSSGRIIFVGLFPGELSFNDPNFHRKEITLMASRNSKNSELSEIIRLIENGKIDTRPWITHQATLEEAKDLYGYWSSPESKTIKAVIHVNY